jgi:drug/metabolite transporter (DMT)-like permease
VVLKVYIKRYGSTIPTFITLASGGVLLFIVALLVGENPGELNILGIREWLWILYFCIGATSITYIVFNLSLHKVGVVSAMSFKLLIPVFGVLLSLLFLRERLSVYVYAGTAVVIGSIALIQSLPRTDRSEIPFCDGA